MKIISSICVGTDMKLLLIVVVVIAFLTDMLALLAWISFYHNFIDNVQKPAYLAPDDIA